MAGLLPYKVLNEVPVLSETQDWHLVKTHVPDVWVQAAGEGIRVGVVDTGVSLSHPDVIHALNEVKNFTAFDDDDFQGHGTHCCGIIGARVNGVGVQGVAPACRIYSAKALGDDGSGSDQSIAAAMDWLISCRVHIISMSLGSNAPSPQINAMIDKATSQGIDVVVAAGNSGPNPNTQEWPSRHPAAIAVAAVDENGQIASFSSRGPHIAIAAPGVNILSTFKGKGYARLSGTSMATPFVAACIALARSAGDKRPATQILKEAALSRDDTSSYGWGLVNPIALIKPSTPPPPTQNPGEGKVITFDNGIKVIVPVGVNYTTQDSDEQEQEPRFPVS